MLRFALALFAIQAGFHGFTASLPLALARGGLSDPQIGLIVGVAALVQVPAAFAVGALIDRFGGQRLFALRVPSGWLADRMRPILLVMAGLAATTVAVLLLGCRRRRRSWSWRGRSPVPAVGS